MTPEDVERFWSKVTVREPGACWEWRGAKHPDGYGSFSLGGKMVAAHRVAYELANGPILGGLHVCHACDNRPCVNAGHLWLGTNADNKRDQKAKGEKCRMAASIRTYLDSLGFEPCPGRPFR